MLVFSLGACAILFFAVDGGILAALDTVERGILAAIAVAVSSEATARSNAAVAEESAARSVLWM